MTAPMVGIVNLQMGNLRSVSNAVDSLGFDHCLVEAPEDMKSVTHLILPGVGSFHRAMQHMHRSGMDDPVREFGTSGRPLLGLCLGMQLLGSTGEEGEEMSGLGLIPGDVRKLDADKVEAIPHVGWNSVELNGPHPVFDGVRTGVDFYFVHSYYFKPTHSEHALGVTDCGEQFVSVAGAGNVIGFQFHPEKSQANGLRLLDNFCGWDGRC